MHLNKIIVHELNKEINVIGASCNHSNALLPIDYKSIHLINKLDEKYRVTNVSNGVFDNRPEAIFPTNFRNLIANYDDNTFISFTIDSTNLLKEQIKNINPAKGGYFVFADYNKNGNHLFGVFLIRNTEGILFEKNIARSSFLINQTTHIDLERLAMACRINVQRFSSNDGKYLSFMKHKIPDISDYFINWIAATEIESSTVYTEELYRITPLLPRPSNMDGSEMSLDDFRKNIYDYMLTQPEGNINMNNMSRHFYNDEGIIVNFIEENNITIDTEFKIDRRKAKKFVRIDINADGIQLRFTRGEYSTLVRIDETNRNRIIIESEKFADKLREQLDQDE